jgi:hypothetical protein
VNHAPRTDVLLVAVAGDKETGMRNNDDVARAARRLLQPLLDSRVEAVAKLAAAAGEVDTAEAAVAAARQRTTRARASYQERRREALGAGWRNPELESLGLPAQYARPAPQRRHTASPAPPAPGRVKTDASNGREPTTPPADAEDQTALPKPRIQD